jgi:2,3-bisphosphoglycerate-independent phosphoglycerate mutase
MPNKQKTIIFLGDGMADEPIASLGNRTPLQYARTPAMDSIAREGRCGSLLTLPAGFPTSSEVANMSVLGCDLATEYCGRGPLEAAGRNIPLGPADKAFRLNLTNVSNGVLKDFSGGHVKQEDANELVAVLNRHFGAPDIRFHTGVSYRNILILSGPRFSHRVACEKPDDNQGEPVAAHLPKAQEAAAEETAAFLRKLMLEAPTVLENTDTNRRLRDAGAVMANSVWPWSGGTAGALRTLKQRYGVTGAVISAVDVIVGLGRLLGMDVIKVPGATGYIDTNYEGKADAAIAALQTHDFVYLHLEAIDEVSHEQNLEQKIKAIEDFDQRIIGRVLAAVGKDVNVAILPDHPVPVAIGKHTRTPVPVAVRMRGVAPDAVQTYDELTCPKGNLGAMRNGDLMNLLFA